MVLKRKGINFIIFLLCNVAIITAFGQKNSFKFTHLNTDDGLSTNTVNCVFKDSRGFIWIGTVDGLNLYNGYTIKVFKNDPHDSASLVNDRVTSIAEDQEGNLWIATNGGISVYDWHSGTFRNLVHKDQDARSLTDGHVKQIVIDESDHVLVATLGGGLNVYNKADDSFKAFQYQEGNAASISNNIVFSILEDRPGFFWVGTHSGSVDLLDLEKGTFQRNVYDQAFAVPTTNHKPLLKDQNGHLWIGTDGDGAYKYDPEKGTFQHFTPSREGLHARIVTALYQDEFNRIWFGSDGSGISILDPKTGTISYLTYSLYNKEGLSSNTILSMSKDNFEVLWVTTFRGGVNAYSKYRSKFDLFQERPDTDNALSFNSVIAIAEDQEGKIWLGTDGGGLDRFDPKTGNFTHLRHIPGDRTSLSSNVIKSICQDHLGYIWAGTYAGGLNRLDPATGAITIFNHNPDDPRSLAERSIWAITEDQDGDLWIGTLGGGLDLYDRATNSFIHYPHNDSDQTSLSSNKIIVMTVDSKNRLWIGTQDQGLNLFDEQTGKFRRFQQEQGLLSNAIKSLKEDAKGNLLIGTGAGLNVLNLETMAIAASDVNSLLPSLIINGIQEDDSGNLWISTNKGISMYDPGRNAVENFSKSDGLQGNEYNYTASLKARSDGAMYFGGLDGFNQFYPDRLKVSPFEPNVVISNFYIFDQELTVGDTISGDDVLIEPVSELDEITLSYRQNVFSIAFAALDYTSPERNHYQYQLEGFDDNWKMVSADKRLVTYTNLDPGHYVFRVKGSNSDGRWSPVEKSLEIIITPPWWARVEMKILWAFLFIGSGLVFFRWRMSIQKAKQEELEAKVKEATEQVLTQNDSLQRQQQALQGAIQDTNFVINEAVESGNLNARIDTEGKSGEWKELGESINHLFESILLPFNVINGIVEAMADGDLTLRYNWDARGDVLELKTKLNEALDRLSRLLHDIVKQVDEIGGSSQEMLVSSEEMNVSTGEIASSIGEMSRGAQTQVSRIDEASKLIEGVLTFSANVSRQADSINEAAMKGVMKSEEGKSLINKVDLQMEEIISYSKETTSAIRVNTERSEEVSRVLNIIKDIASQTNLLALNAAIEAAKAGDAGRGFSVVAEQIRTLSEGSNQSVKEIESILFESKRALDQTSQLISNMSGAIDASAQASRDASSSFEEMATSYAETLQLVSGIADATVRQTSDMQKVVKIMEGVVVIAEETAAGTEEMASSSSQLSAGMKEYARRIQTVGLIVEQLKTNVNQFRLNA